MNVPVYLPVAPYAELVEYPGFNFGTLADEPGIYHLAPNPDRDVFIQLVELNWGSDWVQHRQDDDPLAQLAHLIVTSFVERRTSIHTQGR